jgi:hypothetical protein
MMFETAAIFGTRTKLLNSHFTFSSTLAQRVSILAVLLAAALTTTSCGTVAQAAGTQNENPQSLAVAGSLPTGNLPGGTMNEAYNTVLAVGGGNSPYQFSVKTGTLPPGISLNPATGSFLGKPTTAGNFSFEVVVTDLPRHDQGSRLFAVSIVGNDGGGGNVKISVSPTSATLVSNQKQQFTATVSGTSNTGVTWSATTGTIEATGLYTAPTVTSPTNVVVTTTSTADSTKSASAAVTVDPANQQALQITTGALPQGQQGSGYNEVFTATGGTTPYRWSISAGTPPSGIALNSNGDFAGMPTAAGNYSFTVMVTDANSKTATGNFGVTVAAGSGYDGPAQLPIATVSHAMADTPAPGSVVTVNAGGNLQSALNNAQCGNTIALQAGATFSGNFEIPAKNCDENHWIIVRTSAPDSSLPAEGQRLTPCYAGIASLTGRPQYSCNNPKNVLAKIILSGPGDGPITFQSGANHYRLIGLEITRPSGVKGAPTLVAVDHGFTANHLVLDRSWLHGTVQDETRDGFELAGTSNVAVVDSYFSDFHCTASTGSCTDSHAVSGGTGINQDGPFEIADNFLEASGEAIIFGGGGATMTPTDITIHFNHFFKPWQWMKGNTPFQGGDGGNPFVVKNHLELKNAVRVLVEANLMENSWGGFSQTGFGILLTPKNQHTHDGGNVCPICQVTDVTIRYTHIFHAGGGIVMATAISGNGEGGAPAKAGARYSIHDVVMDDISRSYLGLGRLFLVENNWPANPINTVTINHITGFPDTEGGILIMGNKSQNPSMFGFVFSNSLTTTGHYPVWNVGGGDTSCAFSDVPVTSITTCFTTYTFSTNALIASPSHFGPSTWPTGAIFMANPSGVGFVQYNDGNGGNYELQASSPYKNKGSDGKDLGADIVGLNEALANVE